MYLLVLAVVIASLNYDASREYEWLKAGICILIGWGAGVAVYRYGFSRGIKK